MKISVLEIFGEPIAFGGQESYINNQLKYIDYNKFKIEFLTPYYCENNSFHELADTFKGNVYTLDLPFKPGKSRELIRTPLRKFFSSHTYDIVHIHSGSTSVLGIASHEAKKGGSRKVIVHSHISIPSISIKTRILRRLWAINMRNDVDIYCACSRDAARSRFIPSVSETATLLRNGIDVSTYSYSPSERDLIRKSLKTPQDCVVIGNVGRLSREKNQNFIIRIFEYYHSKYNQNSQLWIVGDGEMRSDLEEEIKQRHLQNCVKLIGKTENPAPYYSGMDCFLFPSLYEGFGIAAIEAQSTGLPCVISDTIPKDAIICSDHVKVLSLSLSAKDWVENLVKFDLSRNNNGALEVRAAGYDISDTGRELERLYLAVNQ